MSFLWPHFLWLLAVPASLLGLVRRKGPTRVDRSHPRISRGWAALDRPELGSTLRDEQRGWGRPWRLAVALSLGMLALARPQWGLRQEPVLGQSREIIIALDLSHSMLADDVRPSRLARAKLLLSSLLEQLNGERVGLMVFSGVAFLQAPLSNDYEILQEFLPGLDPGYLPESGSDFEALLETATQSFGYFDADRYLVVLSDGEAQPGPWRRFLPVLRAKKIRVIALGIGTLAGGRIPADKGTFVKDKAGATVISRLQASNLEELAQATDGTYRDASRWVDLPRILQRTVERKRAIDPQNPGELRLTERFQWFLAMALLFALWSGWREFPLRPRSRGPVTPASGTATRRVVSATALLGALLAPGRDSRAEESAARKSMEQPLVETLQRIATKPTPGALDYAELVRHFIAYGQRLRHSQQEVPPSILRDATATIAAGRALNPRATDWELLLREIRALAKETEDPLEPDPTAEPGQNDQEKPGERKATERDRDSGKGKDSKGGAEETVDDQAGSAEEKPTGEAAPPPPRKGVDAFGDGKETSPLDESRRDPPASPPATGAAARTMTQVELSLVLPLHKLDQLRRTDSPVELFRLMQEPKTRPPSEKAQTW